MNPFASATGAPAGCELVGDHFDAAVADVERLGGQVLMPPTDNGWVRKALVTDPAGNRLSLIAPD